MPRRCPRYADLTDLESALVMAVLARTAPDTCARRPVPPDPDHLAAMGDHVRVVLGHLRDDANLPAWFEGQNRDVTVATLERLNQWCVDNAASLRHAAARRRGRRGGSDGVMADHDHIETVVALSELFRRTRDNPCYSTIAEILSVSGRHAGDETALRVLIGRWKKGRPKEQGEEQKATLLARLLGGMAKLLPSLPHVESAVPARRRRRP